MGSLGSIAVDVRSFHLSAPLQPYFTALYLFTITCPHDAPVEDLLHPEWATMRFAVRGPPPCAAVGPGPLEPRWPFVVSGPTSRAIRFALRQSQIWGLGLQPAGFARYAAGSAGELADRIVDGRLHPAFTRFAALPELLGERGIAPEVMAARVEDFLLADNAPPARHERRIMACQTALRDPDVATVAALCERTGAGRRSLERLCVRHFGFPPKLLLRRQRFLRSLAQFTLAGGENWSRALDGQYCDQAHFVHDFKAFMGMTPSDYAAMPHPVIDRILVQRMADQGVLPRTDLPTLLRYGRTPAELGLGGRGAGR